MNLYHSTLKGLRECEEARRRNLQQQYAPGAAGKDDKRKRPFFARFLHLNLHKR